MGALSSYFHEWLNVIDKKELYKIVALLNTIDKKLLCPEYSNIFRAFNLCNYNNLKAIMIGQDPYPQKGVATGILFGNKKEVSEDKLSPSLRVIKNSVIKLHSSNKNIIFDTTMETWAKNILMINASLSCELGKTGCHTMFWRPFITSFLDSISSKKEHITYVLFGNVAQSLENHIRGNNSIIKVPHPAYYARIHKDMPSQVFTSISKSIESNLNLKIKWYN